MKIFRDHRAFFDEIAAGPYGKLLWLLRYGRESGEDSDYLAVYEKQPLTEHVVLGRLDLFAIGRNTLLTRLGLMDPQLTEPILTGSLVAGAKRTFATFQANLLKVRSMPESLGHLLRRSHASYLFALESYDLLCEQRDWGYQRLAAVNLSFAITYHIAAGYYGQRRCHARRIADLIARSPRNYRLLFQDISDVKHSHQIKPSRLLQCLLRWERLSRGQ